MKQGVTMVHIVSAFYCPDGKRYEWWTNERGAKLLREILENKAKQPGDEWADVKVVNDETHR